MGRKKKIIANKKEDSIVNDDIYSDMDGDYNIESIEEEFDNIEEFGEEDDANTSKHKISGVHSLKYDSIFKGKKDVTSDENSYIINSAYRNDNYDIDSNSDFWGESNDNEHYVKAKNVKDSVYRILTEKLKLSFFDEFGDPTPRRKVAKTTFNNYYYILKAELEKERFSNVELFLELSAYFSDNYLTMLELLDIKWRILIIEELKQYNGRKYNNNEITMRNLNIGSEVEFKWFDDILNEDVIIKGFIVNIYNKDITVDTHEKIYDVTLKDITKIVNKYDFRNNLNKLIDTDFL